MSREIKFRAWNRFEKRMVYKSLFDRNWYYTPKNDDDGCHTAYECMPHQDIRHSEAMQFIGLKDKNGREIYEGDVVRAETEKAMMVSWNVHFASFCLDRDGWMFTHYFGEAVNPDQIEVIGNIYETPELLP